jgi:hypothetical protein
MRESTQKTYISWLNNDIKSSTRKGSVSSGSINDGGLKKKSASNQKSLNIRLIRTIIGRIRNLVECVIGFCGKWLKRSDHRVFWVGRTCDVIKLKSHVFKFRWLSVQPFLTEE